MNDSLAVCEYAASTKWGDLHLSVPLHASPMRVSTLAKAGALIGLLEKWCGQGIYFQSEPAMPGRWRNGVGAAVCDAGLAPPGTELHLPHALLRGSVPPSALQGAALSWQAQMFDVTLAWLDASMMGPEGVQEGRVLLLPESFRSPWRVQLNEQQGLGQLAGHFDFDEGVIHLLAPHAAAEPSPVCPPKGFGAAWQVRLLRPVPVDLPVVMGWQSGRGGKPGRVPIDFSCDQDGVADFGIDVLLSRPLGGDRFAGMVVPVVMGAALRVRASHRKT